MLVIFRGLESKSRKKQLSSAASLTAVDVMSKITIPAMFTICPPRNSVSSNLVNCSRSQALIRCGVGFQAPSDIQTQKALGMLLPIILYCSPSILRRASRSERKNEAAEMNEKI
jgi:hypothetical protein